MLWAVLSAVLLTTGVVQCDRTILRKESLDPEVNMNIVSMEGHPHSTHTHTHTHTVGPSLRDHTLVFVPCVRPSSVEQIKHPSGLPLVVADLEIPVLEPIQSFQWSQKPKPTTEDLREVTVQITNPQGQSTQTSATSHKGLMIHMTFPWSMPSAHVGPLYTARGTTIGKS